jgi:hypothetical protein
MIKLILTILEKIPYRTVFGLSLADVLKVMYNKTHPYKCLCGGIILTIGIYPDGWVTDCNRCGLLIDED